MPPFFSCFSYSSGQAILCRSLPMTACGSSTSVTATATTPSSPVATHTKRPMKLTKLVPCSSSCAIMALLSPLAETWQSVQVLVSAPRTVCGTWVLNA